MSQQVTQRDRPLCWSKLGIPYGIESVEHLGRAERWVDVGHRSIKRKLVLLDELQRGDAKHRIAGHGRPALKPAPAENALIDDALVSRSQGHHPRQFPSTRRITKNRVELGKRSYAGSYWLFGTSDRRIVRA